MDFGDDELRQPEAGVQFAEVGHRTDLVAEVELLANLCPQADEVGDRVPGLADPLAGHQPRHRFHHLEVGRDDACDSGPEHLHRDIAAVVELRPMDDRDRGRSHGFMGKLGEEFIDWGAEIALDGRLDELPGHRRALVEAASKLVRHPLRHEGGRRGHCLPELHVGSPKPFEGAANGSRARLLAVAHDSPGNDACRLARADDE